MLQGVWVKTLGNDASFCCQPRGLGGSMRMFSGRTTVDWGVGWEVGAEVFSKKNLEFCRLKRGRWKESGTPVTVGLHSIQQQVPCNCDFTRGKLLSLSHPRSQGAGSVGWHGSLMVSSDPRMPSCSFGILSSEPRHLSVQRGSWASVSFQTNSQEEAGRRCRWAHLSAGKLPLSGLPDHLVF